MCIYARGRARRGERAIFRARVVGSSSHGVENCRCNGEYMYVLLGVKVIGSEERFDRIILSGYNFFFGLVSGWFFGMFVEREIVVERCGGGYRFMVGSAGLFFCGMYSVVK